MAKKQKMVVEQPKVEVPVMETPKPKIKKVPHAEDGWEIKDRNYYLVGEKSPLSYSIRSSDVFYFDEVKGYERELKYTENQKTCFVDEFPEGSQSRLAHIIFRNGSLKVPRNKQTLQKLLSLYHPHNGRLFREHNPVKVASNEIDLLELEIQALNEAKNLDIDMAEAVMRVQVGSKVSEMSSKELKRDLLLYAKKNPRLFLELVNDPNVQLRNFGIKATELGILILSPDQRTFMWGSTDRKLIKVPFDENPYSALAAYFKTDDGIEVFQNIEKKLK